jgi:hypothetical protein
MQRFKIHMALPYQFTLKAGDEVQRIDGVALLLVKKEMKKGLINQHTNIRSFAFDVH